MDIATSTPVENRTQTAAEPAADSYVTVPIAGMHVCSEPGTMLVTYALGSCVGVTVHDPTLHVGALLHVMLPSSQVHPEAAARRPAMYVDTGIDAALQKLAGLGCERQNLVVKLAGGGQLLSASPQLAMGARNIEAVRAACAARGLTLAAEDVGGTRPRNLRLHVGSGRAVISSRGREQVL